jgi:regulator of sigma E protease
MTAQVIYSGFESLFFWTVPFLLVLGAVVIIHELGHFWAARALGIQVETFSVGFGPEIGGIYDKRGTRWRLAWIPLGGYVKFKGDENPASLPSAEEIAALKPEERVGNFHTSPIWRRALVVAAGPFANFLLCLVIFTGWFWSTGINYREAEIICVEPGMPADRAGLKAGDKILAVSGAKVRSFDEFRRLVMMNARSELNLTVDRAGKTVSLQAVPDLTKQECIGQLGVVGPSNLADIRHTSIGFVGALGESFDNTWQNITTPFQFLGQLVRGNACASQLGGPVKIAEASKQMASESLINLIPLIALLSVSVGLFNLFPIPVLDGGHLLFYGAEAILGHPLNRRAQEIAFQIGFLLILMLMVFVTFNNLADLWRKPQQVQRIESVCQK